MNPRLLRVLLPAVALAVGVAARTSPAEETAEAPRAARPASPPQGDEAAEELAPRIDRAIDRGVAYLVESQNRNGSWGTPAGNLYDIYAPIPGSYFAFEVAVSALAVSALAEVGGERPGAEEALRRGADYLLANHRVKRISQDTIYNTWSHAYAIEAFARLAAREDDPERRERYLEGCREALDLLDRFEYVDGGWGYYDFATRSRGPGPGTTSFTTATVLVALAMAQEQGVEIPERLAQRGLAIIERSRMPQGAFAYSLAHRFSPHRGINKVKGSLARTPACYLALDAWGRPEPADKVADALENLERYGHFLLIARKYPVPHETWYQNSGYFCFYGYYYASRLLDRVPEDARPRERARIAEKLLPLQEQDGSFWDYQLYSYHKPYGTAYVLMTLARCK